MQKAAQAVIEDRYEVLDKVASNGLVDIFSGYDRALDRGVLVQLATPEGAHNNDFSRLFLRHQQIASSVQTCPLLTVYDAGTWEGRPFSVMESDKGARPEVMFRPGYPTDVPSAVRVARETAEALQCLRNAGLVDWTFTPEAVRITDDGGACLAVFEGLSGPYSSSRAN